MTEPDHDAQQPIIETLRPPAAISGGDFEIRGKFLCSSEEKQPTVRFGETAARLVVGGRSRIVVKVPEEAVEGSLVLEYNGHHTAPAPCSVGRLIAQNLHPVANPAVDERGAIYTTRSGQRGETVPVSVFKIEPDGAVRPFASDIVNPTGLLIGPEGRLYVSGRNNGTIYAVDDEGRVEVYAEGMGVATGLAGDGEGNLFVGDRTGTIFKINAERQIYVFATLEPSIAAYHLAFGPDGGLYVAGPTTSSFDPIYRVSPDGEVEPFARGFGRPQGIAFDRAGNLYVAASHRGRRGVFRRLEDGSIEQVISGPGIVGLAFLPDQDLVAATTDSIYRISTAGWIPS